ncbi:S8 family peptidase [Falsibacillus pallidus]|uniref:S8 family peptidase n=1 Tax=Falsibacillus pallidus TaxID=493781 RepID=UPI003D96F6A7
MKKWIKTTAALSASAALMVPGAASAAQLSPLAHMKAMEMPDVLKELKKSSKEKKTAAYQRQQEQQDMKQQISTDTLVIKYDKPIAKGVHVMAGTRIVSSIPGLGYDVVKLSKGQDIKDVIAFYSKQKGVIKAQPSFKYKSLGFSDPKEKEMYQLSLLHIDDAIKMAGKNDVTVAVIDTGMDLKHPDLKNQFLPPYNAVQPANTSLVDVHGTHVAGIIASEKDNGIGGHGINPHAKILPIDVFNGDWGAYDYAIANGILYAIDHGADVINMSLGGYNNSPLMAAAVQKAIDAGITIVAAAGNEGWDEYSYPASYEGVIGVGATDANNDLAYFSNYGSSVDVVAPGVDVYSSVYDFMKGSSFAKMSGTSMASPVVAGVVSLIKSKYPDLKPFQVEALLEKTAKDLGAKGYDLKYGNGLVDPVKALQYDIKKLPAMGDHDPKNGLKKAAALKTEGEDIQKGSFTQPQQYHWYKIDLKKGEYLQTQLEGDKQYDYAMDLYYQPKDPKNNKKDQDKPIKVNDVKAGHTEGYLYKADSDGTLLIAVKDANGSYSSEGKSAFTLKTEKLVSLSEDKSSKDNMIALPAIPYSSDEDKDRPFTLASSTDDPDKDYFTFSVDEPTTLSIDVSGIPGLNSSLAVYFKDEFTMEQPEGAPPREPSPFAMADSGGKGDAEKLTFEAVPGMEYVLEVSGGSQMMGSYFMNPFMMMGFNNDLTPGKSNLPYTLKVDKLNIPADEDPFPQMLQDIEQQYMEGNMSKEEFMKAKIAQFKQQAADMNDPDFWMNLEHERNAAIMDNAIDLETGMDTKGYFQGQGDEDYYKFTASEDAVYQFSVKPGENQMPWGIVMEYNDETQDLIPIGDVMSDNWMMPSTEEVTSVLALKKDKQYVVRLTNDMWGASSTDPYVLNVKKLMSVPNDEGDKDENTPVRAKVIKPNEVTDNYLVYSDDTDFFYYKNRGDDKVFNLQVTPGKLSDKEKRDLPKRMQDPMIVGATIVEDTNGNMQIDGDEADTAMVYGPSYFSPIFDVNASFKAKKGAGYFIVTNSYNWGSVSLKPYQVAIVDSNRKDEDAGSKVVNNVPSKPLSLKASKGGWTATGYINGAVEFGDKDYYKLTLNKASSVSLSLSADQTLDGKMVVYDAKGNVKANLDYYGTGDDEMDAVTLDKGTYYIEVSETFGRTSTKPYTLKVALK